MLVETVLLSFKDTNGLTSMAMCAKLLPFGFIEHYVHLLQVSLAYNTDDAT